MKVTFLVHKWLIKHIQSKKTIVYAQTVVIYTLACLAKNNHTRVEQHSPFLLSTATTYAPLHSPDDGEDRRR